MKFQCERCKTRYSIADEKVRGKILKIRCKTCSSIVTVRDPTVSSGQAPALSATGSFGAIPSATGSLQFVPRPPPAPMPTEDEGEPTRPSPTPAAEPPPDEWFISIDGRQEGPFTPEHAQARVAKRRGDEEMFAWREDFSEWLPVEDIPLLARHFPKAKPPAPPSMFGDAPEDAEPPPRAPDVHDGMDFNISDASRVVRMPLLAPRVAGKRDGLHGLGSVANGTAPRSGLRDPSPQESLKLPIASLSREMAAKQPPRTTTDASVVAPTHKRRRRTFYLVTFGGTLLAAGVLVGAITLIGRKGDEDPSAAANDPVPQVVTNFYEKNSILQTTPSVPQPPAGETGAARAPATNGNPGKGAPRRVDVGGSKGDQPRIAATTGPSGPGGKVDTFGSEGPRVGPLTPDDVRETYLANEVMLKRCYERSLKADMSASVSKMDVKITIDSGGAVTRINVPQESGLAICVSTAIRNWRFRRSSDGLTTEFTVVFAKRG